MTLVSQKELLYSEMFFSSRKECNDPFDSKTYYEFPNDTKKWTNLLKLVSKSMVAYLEKIINFNKMASDISKNCPLLLDYFYSSNFIDDFEQIIRNNIKGKLGTQNLQLISKEFINGLRNVINRYCRSERYFVSFSANPTDNLLWSHYASRHEGFCLIFRDIEGFLNQSQKRIKKQLTILTPNGLAPRMSYSYHLRFKFNKIQYKNEVKPLNAFYCFPESVAGSLPDNKGDIFNEMDEQYCHKHISWKYEEEYRILLNQPLKWLAGTDYEYSQVERLFHYQPTHLVGVILGSEMKKQDQDKMKDIIYLRKEWIERENYQKIPISDFIIFKASKSYKSRKIEVTPEEICSYRSITKGDKDFQKTYEEWQKGRAIIHDKQRGRKVYNWLSKYD